MLISVHTEDGKEVDLAKDIFEHAGAHDIFHTGETSVKSAACSPLKKSVCSHRLLQRAVRAGEATGAVGDDVLVEQRRDMLV